MNFRIRRRRFGQLVIAGATATIALVTNLTSKTAAQQSKSNVIYGLKIKQSQISDTAKVENSTPGIIIQSSDVLTGKAVSTVELPDSNVENSQTKSETAKKAISISPSERLTDSTVLSDGTLVVASVASSLEGDITRLIFVDSKSFKSKKGLKLTGFKKKNSTVESLVATKDGKLLSVVSLNSGVPPFELAVIDPQTGKVASGAELGLPVVLPKQRLSNLAQSPDGKFYAIMLGAEFPPTLVQLDLEYKSPATGKGRIIKLAELKFNKKALGNDVLSLAFSSLGQLYVLANPNNEKTNSLFSVDAKTGEMGFLTNLDADKVVFSR